jgi:hypothetical protein
MGLDPDAETDKVKRIFVAFLCGGETAKASDGEAASAPGVAPPASDGPTYADE